MPAETVPRGWLSPLVYLTNNWISLVGVVLTTTAAVFWLFLLPSTFGGAPQHPYLGILTFMMVPGVFFLGLALIPFGIYWRQRKERHRGIYPAHFPPLTWSSPELRRLLLFVLVTTAVNIVIASQVAYGAVTYMDSVTFCGETCHKVMQPEFTAYQNSPHSRVECVSCHIGPGASWFVRSKLSGTWQVFAVAFNIYPRPIPVPIQNLRPARETCETCHWPQRYGEDRLRIVPHFAEDEANTFTRTVLLMKIGGGDRVQGIHGSHLAPGIRIHYAASDPSRQTIPWVEYRKNGRRTLYLAPGAAADPGNMPVREMDCIDCHNRPTHTFQLPEPAVNLAMAAGDISPALPFAKKKTLELVRAAYGSREAASAGIPAAFSAFYRRNHPEVYRQRTAEVERSARSALGLYLRNVFPHMRVTWGTYANNIGHTDFPGCFRCHDEQHTSAEGGKQITQDCNACHNLLAVEEAEPAILKELGIERAAPPPQ